MEGVGDGIEGDGAGMGMDVRINFYCVMGGMVMEEKVVRMGMGMEMMAMVLFYCIVDGDGDGDGLSHGMHFIDLISCVCVFERTMMMMAWQTPSSNVLHLLNLC